jgi:hypothetical protein
MKKILLVLILIRSAYQLKAQQFNLKPADSLLFKTPTSLYGLKPGDSALFKNFKATLQSNTLLAMLSKMNQSNDTGIFYSRMPEVKLQSNDNMAILKPSNSNEHYTMLIKRLKVVDPLAKTAVANP